MANDNTISIDGQVTQIPPNKIRFSLVKTKVTVCILEDDRVFVLCKSSIICEEILLKGNKNKTKKGILWTRIEGSFILGKCS
ncbi:hypothetical protein KKB84_02265 [bacterium]|nr:hypothetical protein [bacterium]MBU1152780.1 hypothetical protein [bacterium]